MGSKYLKATGNWADNNTWSATDGGAAGEAFPVAGDNVYITANGNGLTLTVAATAAFETLTSSGASTATIVCSGGNYLNPTGNVIFLNTMTLTNMCVVLDGNGNANLDMGGKSLAQDSYLHYSGTGTLTLTSPLTSTARIYTRAGGLNTNGQTVTCTEFKFVGAFTRTVTLGNSIINCTNFGDDGSGTLTLNAGTSIINASGTFAGYTKTYNIVNLTGATSTITGSNTFAQLNLTAATTQTITFTDTTTQTITTPSLSGSAGHVHTLQGSAAGGWNLAVPANTNFDYAYISVSRSTVTGGGILYAGAGSTDGGNNVAWAFGKLTVLRGRNVAAAAHNTASDIYKWGSGSGCVLYLNGQQDANSSTIKDLSGYGNHGTITGATWVRLPSGLMVNSFDGVELNVNEIDCGHNILISNNQSFSVLSWVYRTADNYKGIVGKDDGVVREWFMSDQTTGRLRVRIYQTNATAVTSDSDNNVIPINTWTMVAFTVNVSAVKIYYYAFSNGGQKIVTPDMTQAWDGTIKNSNVPAIRIGMFFTGDYRWAGYIGLSHIFNTALSPTQINGIFQSERSLFGV
jgi:hypothetical protein